MDSQGEDLLRKKITPNPELSNSIVDLNSYSKETLDDKSKLEKNGNCLICLEKNGNTLVRNQVIEEDSEGNKTRYYIYNVVNESQIFAANVSEFSPGKYLADDVDKEISIFLKKNISKPEQIESIQDARVAVLAGVIEREDYVRIKERLSSKKPEVTTLRDVSEKDSIPNTQTNPGLIENNKLSPELNADVLIRELTEKYFSKNTVLNEKLFVSILEDLERIDIAQKTLEKNLLENTDQSFRNLVQQKIDNLKILKQQIIDLKSKVK